MRISFLHCLDLRPFPKHAPAKHSTYPPSPTHPETWAFTHYGASLHLPADEVCKSASDARAKDGVPRSHSVLIIHTVLRGNVLNLCLKDDRNDDPVDGHGFTEDDADGKSKATSAFVHIEPLD